MRTSRVVVEELESAALDHAGSAQLRAGEGARECCHVVLVVDDFD